MVSKLTVTLPQDIASKLQSLAADEDLPLPDYAALILCSAARRRSLAQLPIGLTPRQMSVMEFLKSYVKGHAGCAPNYDEIRDALGLKSKSGVVRLLSQLEERGAIRRVPRRSRAITLCDAA